VAVSWWKLFKAAPEAKTALDKFLVPGASQSATIWFNLIKAGITVATALGLYVVLSHEEIETISTALALAVPALATLGDMVANIWLRIRTKSSLQEKFLAAEAKAETKVEDEHKAEVLADKVDRSRIDIDSVTGGCNNS